MLYLGGVDDAPELGRVLEVGGQFHPVLVPGLEDLRILLRPFLPEFLQSVGRVVQGWRTIYALQVRHDRLDIFIGYKLCTIADLVDHAQLLLRVRKRCLYRTAKPCQVIPARHQNRPFTRGKIQPPLLPTAV